MNKYREALHWYEHALVEQRNQLKNNAATSKELERSFLMTLFSTCLLCCQLGYQTKVRGFLEQSYFRGLGNVEAEVLAAREYDIGVLKGALFTDTILRDRPKTYEDVINLVQVGGFGGYLMSPFWRVKGDIDCFLCNF
ncbi:hypothetical protein BDD12DRAFT_892260 [Trichophaea hybrida]|nr:hypothetical protein BDD12DRAFT_892260 [Trichophaea hybrida]